MSPTFYYILHVTSILVLTGYTFYAFAAAPETRKKVMIITGIASLLAVVSGFGLISKIYANNFAGWMFVKLACWLALSALAGLGYRKRHNAGLFAGIAVTAALVAVIMVYTKPF